jgi:hypothetical protein
LKLFYSLPLLLIAASLLIISCSDEPSSIGIDLIGSDYIVVKTFDSASDTINQSSSYFKHVIPLGASDWILIGKKQNTTASTLLKFIFILPDSLKTDVLADDISVTSSWIELRSAYTYTQADTLGTMNFTVHEVNSYWTYTLFTFDSLSKLQYDPVDVSSNFIITDSSYTFNINNSLTLAWMKNSADNTVESNFGIYLAPIASSNKIVGFQSITPVSTKEAKLNVVIEKAGAYVDTISAISFADVSLVDGPLPTLPSGLMCVQSSVSINSRLKFDFGVLPPGIVINKAELIITNDPANGMKGSSYNNSIKALYLADDSLTTQGNAVTLSYSAGKYSGDITGFVRSWVSTKQNFGMLLQSGNQLLGLDLFALKGSDYPEVADRPRLRITYTQQKNK